MTAGPELTDSQRRAGLGISILCIAVAALAIGLTFPLLALLLEGKGYSGTAIGINSAMGPLAILLSSAFVPRWIARFGAKRFIVMCVLANGVTMILFKMLDWYAVWLVLRLLSGVAVAGLFVASESWINQVARSEQRAQVMAIYNISLSAGFALGPVLLGFVGVQGWAPFIIGAAIMFVASIPMIFVPVVAPRFDGTPSFNVLTYVKVAPTLVGAILLYAMIENSTSSMISVFGRRSGLADQDALIMLSAVVVGGMFFAWPVGWLADRYDKIRLMMILGVIGVVGALAVPFTVQNLWLCYSILFVWGGAGASLYTIAMALQGERFSGADLVTANAAFGVLYGVGSLLGPAMTGVAMDLDDPNGYSWVMTGVCLIFVIFTVFRQRAKRRGSAG